MLDNMRIGAKLLIICGLLVIIPLAVVTWVSVQEAGRGLQEVENEQMAARSLELAQVIDRVLEGEQKLMLLLAQMPAVRQATAAVAAGRADDLAARVAAAHEDLRRFAGTKEVAANTQAVMLLGTDGVAFASSDAEYIGKSFADRGYVQAALEGRLNAGETGINKVTGKPFVPIAAPIYDETGTRVIGAAANVLDIGFVEALIADVRIGKTGYAYVLDRTGLFVAHPDKEQVFKTNLTQQEGTAEFARKMVAGQSGVDRYLFEGVAKTCGYAPVRVSGWSMALTLPDSEYLAPVNAVRNIALIVMAVALAAAILILILFVRGITKPLSLAVGYARQVAEGDFTHRLDIRRKDEVGGLIEALNQMVDKLKDTVLQIRQAAEQVASSSEEISSSAQQLAEGSQSQASTLEETSASVEELTASVEQVSRPRPEPGGLRGGVVQQHDPDAGQRASRSPRRWRRSPARPVSRYRKPRRARRRWARRWRRSRPSPPAASRSPASSG